MVGMESSLSERFKLGANIGRSHQAHHARHHEGHDEGPPNPLESFDSRDDSADRTGRTDNFSSMSMREPIPMLPSTAKPPRTSNSGAGGGVTRYDHHQHHAHHHHDISRTISQDTAETATMSILSDATGVTNASNATEATLDAAIAASARDGGHVLELSTIQEDKDNDDSTIAGTATDGPRTGATHTNNTPAAKSNAAVAAPSAAVTDTNIQDDNIIRSTFPDFVGSMPKTWSGSSLSFIKFLLFVKESDESFIPEMDRMLADYDMLVRSLKTENAVLKEKLRTEIAALKKRIHEKKKLVSKLTKKLTDCQKYIAGLTDELGRIYREKGIASGRSDLASSRPSDDVTVATATSEITLEQCIQEGHQGGVEAILSRMLAEERSKADTLADLNKSLTDDLNDTKREVEELERKLGQSERSRIGLERTFEGHWTKMETLIEENRTLQEDLAGVVIDLSDAQEEFSEREAQLIRMIEQGGGGYYGHNGDNEDDMTVDEHNVHHFQANIEVLQEELSISKRVLDAIKERENESTHRAGELLIHNETLRTQNEVIEGLHKEEMNNMKEELSKLRAENAYVRKRTQENDVMVGFARQIIASKGGNSAALGASNFDKDRRIAELERQVSFLRRDQDYRAERAASCLRDTLVYLYDCAAGSTEQDPSSLIKAVRETSMMFVKQPAASSSHRAIVSGPSA